ncbi:UV DNA damage repair endonuclease UvsE [Syntrophomonas palmitatica]|uniref:UV DNA damage repair endonuclease UvsE n=1 Tax=Syntrophomonas palmitatica TaxID=402877 RepID=UPI0006D09784|nr:UV DNA damage repair endonuclease UvsE [Syntrophomonas palmitatica]
MSIGYACIALGLKDSAMRGCVLKNARPEKLNELIAMNLNTLGRILEYNLYNGIRLFRISSGIIPFGSHPVNRSRWWEMYEEDLRQLGDKIKRWGMRVSMHPGQYTVLNSPDKDTVQKAISDLEYHGRFLDSLGLGLQHKIILHLGGIYGDRSIAMKNFINNYGLLSENTQKRLVLENDEKYDVREVLTAASFLDIPVVFDVFHHSVNPAPECTGEYEWINACRNTWKAEDGRQKLHYSQQEPGLKAGAHSRTIQIDEFINFYKGLPIPQPDIMLEVKDKDLSALKCIAAINQIKGD